MENTQYTQAPKKKNIALRGCGCLLIVAFVAFIAIVLYGVFMGDKENKPDDPRKELLKQDLEKLDQHLEKVSADSAGSDSIADFLKPCVDVSIEGIKTEEIKYYTKINGNKLLVLLKVGDMKEVEKSSRKLLVEAVEDCLSVYDLPGVDEHYIGVDGNWNMLMVKTPHGSDLAGKFADSDLLLPFYDQAEGTMAADTTEADSAR